MFLSNPTADDAVQALFREAESEDGYVMNFLRLWAWRPDVHVAFNETRQLLASTTLLSEREVAILNSTTASRSGDAYCSISWGTKLAGLCDAAMAAALLRGDDTPAFTPRERALVAWASAVVENPDIFEATLFVAFRLAFMTVNDALGAQPDRQLAQAAPTVVLESVTFGRTVHDRSIESQP
jgi:alkylhydroperoxidase family enzyme